MDDLWQGLTGQVAWDIGAGQGGSIPQLLEVFERVEAFEPSVEDFAVMALEWVDKFPVGLHRVAVSDHDGTLEIITGGKESVVLCESVNSLVRRLGFPDLLHVDVDGQETQVLAGAEDLLRLGRTGLLIKSSTESNHEQCVKILKDAGYLIRSATGWIRAEYPQ